MALINDFHALIRDHISLFIPIFTTYPCTSKASCGLEPPIFRVVCLLSSPALTYLFRSTSFERFYSCYMVAVPPLPSWMVWVWPSYPYHINLCVIALWTSLDLMDSSCRTESFNFDPRYDATLPYLGTELDIMPSIGRACRRILFGNNSEYVWLIN